MKSWKVAGRRSRVRIASFRTTLTSANRRRCLSIKHSVFVSTLTFAVELHGPFGGKVSHLLPRNSLQTLEIAGAADLSVMNRGSDPVPNDVQILPFGCSLCITTPVSFVISGVEGALVRALFPTTCSSIASCKSWPGQASGLARTTQR